MKRALSYDQTRRRYRSPEINTQGSSYLSPAGVDIRRTTDPNRRSAAQTDICATYLGGNYDLPTCPGGPSYAAVHRPLAVSAASDTYTATARNQTPGGLTYC